MVDFAHKTQEPVPPAYGFSPNSTPPGQKRKQCLYHELRFGMWKLYNKTTCMTRNMQQFGLRQNVETIKPWFNGLVQLVPRSKMGKGFRLGFV